MLLHVQAPLGFHRNDRPKGGSFPMPNITAPGHRCGLRHLTPQQVQLVVCSWPAWSYYLFSCDSCGVTIRNAADQEITAVLRLVGVATEQWVIPAEALEIHHGPPISYDDVLDFALNLERTHLLATMITA